MNDALTHIYSIEVPLVNYNINNIISANFFKGNILIGPQESFSNLCLTLKGIIKFNNGSEAFITKYTNYKLNLLNRYSEFNSEAPLNLLSQEFETVNNANLLEKTVNLFSQVNYLHDYHQYLINRNISRIENLNSIAQIVWNNDFTLSQLKYSSYIAHT